MEGLYSDKIPGDPFEAAPVAPIYLSVTDPRTPEEKDRAIRVNHFGERYPAQYLDLIRACETQMKWNCLRANKTREITGIPWTKSAPTEEKEAERKIRRIYPKLLSGKDMLAKPTSPFHDLGYGWVKRANGDFMWTDNYQPGMEGQ